MIELPTLVQTREQKTASITLAVPPSDLGKVVGPAIQEVYATLKAQKIEPAGPWFLHFLRMEPHVMEFEISVPVAAVVQAADRVKPSELAARKAVRTVYHGPYEGLPKAWGEFKEWVRANGHRAAADLWEVYLTGPESRSSAQDWRTELNQPLIE